jgi:hypothetical protein
MSRHSDEGEESFNLVNQGLYDSKELKPELHNMLHWVTIIIMKCKKICLKVLLKHL